jgi:hypothetical protein
MAHRTSSKPDRDKGTRNLCIKNRITEGSIDVTPESLLGTPTSPFDGLKPLNADPERDRSAGQEYMSSLLLLLLARFFRNGKKPFALMKGKSTKKQAFHTKTQCCHF